VALPVAILVSNRLSATWLYAGMALSLALSIALAIENYQVWDGYRQFARQLQSYAETKRVWVNADWGLRFYLESEGALPFLTGQTLRPGEMLVSSGFGQKLRAGSTLSTVAERSISSPIPLRLFSLNGRSAYSSAQFGLRPFDISEEPVDTIKAQVVVEKKAQMESISMNSAASGDQIVSGVYEIENGQYRWMSGKAVILLKPPAQPAPLEIRFFIPDQAPARKVTVLAGDTEVASQTYTAPGTYTLTTPSVLNGTITIKVDKTFSVPGDQRELGIVLTQVGFISGKSSQSDSR
jgi:hypothetical protein